MRLSRSVIAIPAVAMGLLVATAAPAGAGLAACSTTTGCQTFSETGSPQAFTVPAGVVGVTADLLGAGGGNGWNVTETPGGVAVSDGSYGGQTGAALSTTPGATLEVVVGGAGGDATQPVVSEPYDPSSGAGAAGYNGGGAGSSNPDGGYAGGGGGGATEILAGTSGTPLLIAGGGGGGAGSQNGLSTAGGDGGGPNGANGSAADEEPGGGAGTSFGAGAGGGTGGHVGGMGVGTTGGDGADGGGGGGAGRYGGGGGGDDGNNDGTGGGGGSGLLGADVSSGFINGGSGSPGSGVVTISWMTAPTLTVTAGASVTLTANVPGLVLAAAGGHSVSLDAEAEGTETFTAGSTTLCAAVAVVDGAATCTTSALPVGTDDVTATLTEPAVVGSFTVPGSVTLTSHRVSGPADGRPALDAEANPWTGTTEVLAVTVSAVPVPTSGAGIPAGVPPVGVLLIIVGAAGIASTRRLRRAR